MMIAGLAKCSLVDYPGLPAGVIFTPGCNYRCFYCHNRSLIDGSWQLMPAAEVLEFFAKRIGQLDGVVITGGEPTLQPDLLSFLKQIKAMGYQVKVDTNGSNPAQISRIIHEDLVDYFAVDYKAPADRYEEICGPGACAGPVRQTIRLLLDSPVDFEVRTTVIPQLTTHDLISMAGELPVVPRYCLNPYRKPDRYLPEDQARIGTPPYTSGQIAKMAGLMRAWQPHMIV